MATTPERATEAFLDRVRDVPGSPETSDSVRQKVAVVVSGMGDGPLEEWTPARMRTWIAGQAWAPRTVRRALGVARRFLRWVRAEGLLARDFVGRLRAPKIPNLLNWLPKLGADQPGNRPVNEVRVVTVLAAALHVPKWWLEDTSTAGVRRLPYPSWTSSSS